LDLQSFQKPRFLLVFNQPVFAAFDEFLLLRRKWLPAAEVLHPVTIVLCYANFPEAGVHQVFAMPCTFKPALHHFGNALRTLGYIFADGKTSIAGKGEACGPDSVSHSTAIQTGMTEIIIICHVLRVADSCNFQLAIPYQRRRGGYIGDAAIAAYLPGMVNVFQKFAPEPGRAHGLLAVCIYACKQQDQGK